MIDKTIKAARMKIATCPDTRPFSIAALGIDIRIVDAADFCKYSYARVSTNIDAIPTIEICREYADAANKVASILLHEILHVAFEHFTRGKRKHTEIWQIAIDHVINRYLKMLASQYPSHFFYFPNSILITEIEDRNWPAEKVYNWLLDHMDQCPVYSQSSQGVLVANEETLEGEEWNEVKRDVMRGISLSRSQAMKTRDVHNGDALEQILNALDVNIDFDEILEHIIKELTEVPGYAWIPPCRWRMAPEGIYLPGTKSKDYQVLKDLIITIDTSGSIGTDELRKFFNIVQQSSNIFRKIWILQHDVKIQHVESLENIHAQLDKIMFKGRGGTSHKYVFDWIQSRLNNDESVGAVFILSDFDSDVSQLIKSNQYSFWRDVPVFAFDTGWNGADKNAIQQIAIKYYRI